jgi:hypothetical protein
MEYVQYLPEVFRETEEYQALGKAFDPLAAEVKAGIGRVPEEYLPSTAEQELTRWEQVLGLSGSGELSERRFAVLTRLAGVRPYTLAQLKRQLRASMGEGQFTAEVWPEDFLLRVSVQPGAEKLLSAMARELRRMIPANITLETAVGEAQETGIYSGAVLWVSERVYVE